MDKTKHIDGGVLYAYPDYENVYFNLVTDPMKYYKENQKDFVRDYTKKNPDSYVDWIEHNFKRF